ncbi:hypothetical protein [Salmonirosea aquatica]|uniref:Uncharacterized protein n=1 Tax=Salmonirosea aquatica TaxID=2654236 RepID=A0A7C9BLT5_9BACT|nr:hypothetical protein [Cytophagaceae bacterium SJW1-29]
MKKLLYSALAVATFLFIANTVSAQSNTIVDPGYSVNNYKHPNKAKKAKAMQAAPEGTAANAIVEPRRGNRFSHTPKYASRPGSRVLLGTESGREVYLNPFHSPHHYKTPGSTVMPETAEKRYAIKQTPARQDSTMRLD